MADDINILLNGGCACGGVRYRVTAKPLIVHCCHCRWCQRESGSAFALNAMVETDRIEVLKGDPETINTPSASGKGQKIVRCRVCHVALWSHYAGAGDRIGFVRVGSLDTPDELPPDVHIYTSTKQPWVVLPDGATVFEEFYNPRDVWPPESLARAKAARG